MMANVNEPLFLKRVLETGWADRMQSGRVLNVGSREYHGINYTDIFAARGVVGIDLETGPGVDIVCDMEGDCAALGGEEFAMVICASVLEHTAKPWVLAANIERHLKVGGLLYVTVPWVWRTHKYPKDYWRMSPDAVRSLFPSVKWRDVAHSTQVQGEFLNEDVDHDQQEPWRIPWGGRMYIVVQQVHMYGEKQ